MRKFVIKPRLTPMTELAHDELKHLTKQCQQCPILAAQLNAGLNARLNSAPSSVEEIRVRERKTIDLFWSTHHLGVSLNRLQQNMVAASTDRLILASDARSVEELRAFVASLKLATLECRKEALALHPGICADELPIEPVALEEIPIPDCMYH